jgi:hypothetical protein
VSPTARSLALLRKEGWYPWTVEQTIPKTFIKRDAWGIIDIIALGDGEVLAVQATSGDNVSARMAKMAGHEGLAALRKAGVRVEVWGWRKLAKTGRWEVRRVDLSSVTRLSGGFSTSSGKSVWGDD